MLAEILRVHPDEPEQDRIEYIVSCLRSGKVVGIPTDTFYGLAVDPVNLRAVESIYEIKTRLKHKPLSLLIANAAQAYGLARELDARFDLLAERFWPGPLTVIVRAGSRLPLRSTANTGNVALRVPDAAIPRAIVEKLGLPITATSANLQGLPECNYAACVRDQIGDRIPLIVDGGATGRSVATTIVDLSTRWSVGDSSGRSHSYPRDCLNPPALSRVRCGRRHRTNGRPVAVSSGNRMKSERHQPGCFAVVCALLAALDRHRGMVCVALWADSFLCHP